MKRDMDLIRRLLLDIEESPVGEIHSVHTGAFPDHSDAVLRAHVRLLEQAGFMTNSNSTRGTIYCGSLTWEGYEFLDLSRSPGIWKQAKDKVATIGGSVSMEVFKQLLTQIAISSLGAG